MEYNITLDELLQNRSFYNIPLYYTELKNAVVIGCKAPYGELFTRFSKQDTVNMDKFNAIKSYCNQPVMFIDRRVPTHSFSDNTTWVNGTTDSEFKIEPTAGKIYVVTYIEVRFPKALMLKDTNKLVFEVWLSPDGVSAPVKVMDLQYGSLKELVKKMNTPISIPVDFVENMSTGKMIEMQFKYADPYTLKGSPIKLHSSLNEYIVIRLAGNIPVKDNLDADLSDDCWAVVNGKEVIEF